MIRRIALAAAFALAAAPVLAGGLVPDLPHLTWPQKPTTGTAATSAANGR